ncbi:mRNA splicing protein [Blastosporella zonata]|nr:mRNA splicing protein [Blastosporella zonata]
MATALAAILPKPIYAPTVSDDEEEEEIHKPIQQLALTSRPTRPAYGQRKGWKPTTPEDFGDGGAFPECHIAQYPLEMGRKKGSSGNTLALQVDSEGNVRYDAIAQQGQRPDKIIQSQFKDLVSLHHRQDLTDKERSMDRPSEEEVQDTADKTRAALEKIVDGKIKASQPKNVPGAQGKTSFIRYTPGQQNGQGGLQQRIIKMSEIVEDPLEPPRFKHKKIPRGPPSPPPPVLRSPPRKATPAEQKEWMIPPCISNWKNNKGFTIPLDKRLAADGRGLQDIHINDNFAKFSEALFVADRHAREEVRQRSLMQQKLAQKEKEKKEENLRMLAQRAREERGGIAPKPTAASQAAMKSTLADYGSDSGSGSESEGSEEDEEARKIRDQMRQEKRRERERELRMNNMGTEQRAKQLARQQNRDISEKVALGLAKPTLSKESMLDSRLFNQESLSGNFADEDSYNLYDKPLFHGSTAAAAIYKARGNITEGNEDSFGGGTDEGIGRALDNDRFGLGQARIGFEGASEQEVREGPVQFEKDTGDVFGLNQFLDEAKTGKKRGLDTQTAGARKRQQLDRATEGE